MTLTADERRCLEALKTRCIRVDASWRRTGIGSSMTIYPTDIAAIPTLLNDLDAAETRIATLQEQVDVIAQDAVHPLLERIARLEEALRMAARIVSPYLADCHPTHFTRDIANLVEAALNDIGTPASASPDTSNLEQWANGTLALQRENDSPSGEAALFRASPESSDSGVGPSTAGDDCPSCNSRGTYPRSQAICGFCQGTGLKPPPTVLCNDEAAP